MLNNEKEITGTFEVDEKTKEKLQELFHMDKDIQTKIVEIYNYMAMNNIKGIDLQFESKIKIRVSIDDTEYLKERGEAVIKLRSDNKKEGEFKCHLLCNWNSNGRCLNNEVCRVKER